MQPNPTTMRLTFHAFAPVHLAILGMVPILAALLARVQRGIPARRRIIDAVLAALLCIDSVALYANIALRGEPLFPRHLPLELCDACVWLTIAVLLTRRPALFD